MSELHEATIEWSGDAELAPVLDGRAPELADAGNLGHCCWRPSRRLPFEISMGLLLVVSSLLHIWRARLLLHLAALQFLAHG